VLIFRYTEIGAGDPQGSESSASKFETGFEKMKRNKSLVSDKIDPSRRQYIRLRKP
jgi:hypothetical protein